MKIKASPKLTVSRYTQVNTFLQKILLLRKNRNYAIILGGKTVVTFRLTLRTQTKLQTKLLPSLETERNKKRKDALWDTFFRRRG